MSFSDQEKLFVAALVSGIAILGFLLFFDNLQEKPPATEPIGKVRYKNHIAVRKYAGRLVWFDLKKEDDLYPNDTIQTGDNSDAELLLPGNLVLTLESRSLVQLEFRGGKLLLRLAGGGVRLAQQGGGKARIATSSGEIELSNAKATIRTDAASGRADVSVQSGTAVIETAQGTSELTAGNAVSLETAEAGAVAVKTRSVLKIQSPEDGATLVFAKARTTPKAEFVVAGESNDEHTMKIARDPSLSGGKEHRFRGKIVLPLAAGDWYYQIENPAANASSGIRYLRIREVEAVRPVFPPENYVHAVENPTEIKLLLSWRSDPAFPDCILRLYRKEDGTELLSDQTRLNQKSVVLPAPGEYLWRVSNVDSAGNEISSFEANFTVQKQKPQPPEFLLQQNRFSYADVLAEKAVVSWNEIADAVSYRLHMTAPDGSKRTVLRDEPRFVFSPQARPGRYRLRVSAVLNEMQETPPSPEITVTIEGIPDISWQLPDMLNIGANTRVLDPKIGGPGPPYKLRFILSDKEENTVLEQDLSGKKERKLVLEEPLHGTFNAKLLLLSPDRQVLKSLTKTLRISYQPPKVRQFVGLPTLWKPAEQEKLSVRWQAVPEASGYKLSAELRASGKDSSVNLRDVRVQKNSMEFLASEVRAAGTLVVSVQALQEVGDTVLASEPLVAEIPVEYYQKPQKIKIVPGKIRVTE